MTHPPIPTTPKDDSLSLSRRFRRMEDAMGAAIKITRVDRTAAERSFVA